MSDANADCGASPKILVTSSIAFGGIKSDCAHLASVFCFAKSVFRMTYSRSGLRLFCFF